MTGWITSYTRCVPPNEIMWASVAELHYHHHQPQDLYQNSQNKVEKVGCKRNKQLKIEITILREVNFHNYGLTVFLFCYPDRDHCHFTWMTHVQLHWPFPLPSD